MTKHERGSLIGSPDVKVHHKGGCSADGRTDEHTHAQADHQAEVDRAGDKR